MTVLRPIAVLVLGVLLPAAHPTLSAQTVHGRVVGAIGGEPVSRGFVVLLDEAGREVARTISDNAGRFTLHASEPGRYRLRSEVIGYRVWESDPFLLFAGADVQRTLRVERIPIRLAALDIVGERRCAPLREREFSAAVLWEEARKALAAAAWGNQQQEWHSRLHRARRLRAHDGTIEVREIWVASGRATQPFGAVDPAILADHGYVMERGGRRFFYGPDADVLLHPSFQETHCFHAVRGTGSDSGLVGLAFGPVPDRSVPEIAGVAWLDAETAELRRITYRYTNLPSAISDDRLGGTEVFRRLPHGAWIMSDWEIRAPQRDAGGRLAGIVEIEGRVIELFDIAGDRVYRSPDAATLVGVLRDSARAPATGHKVRVRGTAYSATVDSSGGFRMVTLLSGRYDLTTDWLDSLGYGRGLGPAVFVPGDTARLALQLPPAATVRAALCPDAAPATTGRILVGTVRRPALGAPQANMSLEFSWTPPSTGRSTKQERLHARTDDEGVYIACGVPEGVPVTLEAPGDVRVQLEFTDGSLVVRVDDIERRYPAPIGIFRFDVTLFRER